MGGIVQEAALRVVRRKRRLRHNTVTESATSLEGQGLADLGERRRGLVALTQQRLGNRPPDADAGVIPGDPGLGGGVVGTRAEIGDVGSLAEHSKAVAEADWDEELVMG